MTYNPPTLRALGLYWETQGGVNLGVVGDTSHVAKGTSYHLGKDELQPGAYSIATARDKAGLTGAASAIDLGKLDGSLERLRAFSEWLVAQCRRNVPGTRDIREIIYWSTTRNAVVRWDRERGFDSLPKTGEADDSHRTHTHVSFYRDSETRDKVHLFAPYFMVTPAPHFAATVTTPTAVWNNQTQRWVFNGPNKIKVGTRLIIRGAQYAKDGVKCYPIVGPLLPGYFVPVAHVRIGAKLT